MLIPLSYEIQGKWKEFCLEVTGQGDGKCDLRLISNDPHLFGVVGGIEEEGKRLQNLFYGIKDVKIDDFSARLKPLMEIQIWEGMGIKKSESMIQFILRKLGLYENQLDNSDLFAALLSFKDATLEILQETEAKAKPGGLGHLGEVMTYLKTLRPAIMPDLKQRLNSIFSYA